MSINHILAIETSCDETSIAVLESSKKELRVLSNVISSQIKLHAEWGGVVPNLAAREHVKNLPKVLEKALGEAKIGFSDLGLISVVNGPGLIPALLTGLNFAKTLAYKLDKPLLGIHHIEGHIYANFIGGISNDEFQISKHRSVQNSKFKIQNSTNIKFPILCLVVSGGHTQLVLMKDHLRYEIIGQTLDDAVGEAFDKVARILDLGFPGGPAVSALAETASEKLKAESEKKYKIKLPRPMLNSKDFNFSFSGLKTAVLYETKKLKEKLPATDYGLLVPEICHEFQQAAIDVLVSKTLKAAEKYEVKTVMLAGGVSANKELRKQLGLAVSELLHDTSYIIPDTSLTGDNAAMIGAAAHFRWQKMSEDEKENSKNGWKTLQANANLKMA